MARKILRSGEIYIGQLKDLQKGDKVYVTFYGSKYIPVKVLKVRITDCAVIVTVEKKEHTFGNRFVGYYTDSKAFSCNTGILTLSDCWAERAEKALKSASERSREIAVRAEALCALNTLKNWLFEKEDGRPIDIE